MTAPPASPPDLHCAGCDYDLRGIDSGLCPECGLPIDRTGPPPARIPWEQRRRIGRWRAWWRTFWLATLAPSRLAAEVQRNVRYPDALRFRLVTSLAAGLMLGALLVAGCIAYGAAGYFNGLLAYEEAGGRVNFDRFTAVSDARIPWEAGISLAPVQPVAAVLFVALASGMATYWFHPRHLPVERQNAAVALAHYAGAPFLILPVALGAIAALSVMDQPMATALGAPCAIVAVVASALAVWTLPHVPLTLLRLATCAGPGRVVLATVLIVAGWVISAILAFGALPWVVGFFYLFVRSLA